MRLVEWCEENGFEANLVGLHFGIPGNWRLTDSQLEEVMYLRHAERTEGEEMRLYFLPKQQTSGDAATITGVTREEFLLWDVFPELEVPLPDESLPLGV